MRVITSQKCLKDKDRAEEMTYQNLFPLEVKCCNGNKAQLLMAINDDEHLLVKERPDKVRIWPHDDTAIALYLCTHCGEMKAEWNQG